MNFSAVNSAAKNNGMECEVQINQQVFGERSEDSQEIVSSCSDQKVQSSIQGQPQGLCTVGHLGSEAGLFVTYDLPSD